VITGEGLPRSCLLTGSRQIDHQIEAWDSPLLPFQKPQPRGQIATVLPAYFRFTLIGGVQLWKCALIQCRRLSMQREGVSNNLHDIEFM
jgi:hypothetical protein